MDSKIAYANLKRDQEIQAKYSTKSETQEIADSLNSKIARQDQEIAKLQAMVGASDARTRALEVSVSVIRELVETGQKPPADVTIDGKDYHIDSNYQVLVKKPELPAHIVNDYDEEMPF
jgi:hypothetical protein